MPPETKTTMQIAMINSRCTGEQFYKKWVPLEVYQRDVDVLKSHATLLFDENEVLRKRVASLEAENKQLKAGETWFIALIRKVWKQELKENPTKDEIEWIITQFMTEHKELEGQLADANQMIKDLNEKCKYKRKLAEICEILNEFPEKLARFSRLKYCPICAGKLHLDGGRLLCDRHGEMKVYLVANPKGEG